MVMIEQLAEATLNGESLLLRSLTQDLLREQSRLSGRRWQCICAFPRVFCLSGLFRVKSCHQD